MVYKIYIEVGICTAFGKNMHRIYIEHAYRGEPLKKTQFPVEPSTKLLLQTRSELKHSFMICSYIQTQL